MPRHRRLLPALAAATVGALLTGCAAGATSASHGPTGAARIVHAAGAHRHTGPFTPWPTYHRTASRSGTATSVGHRLRPAWRAGLDGAVYGEPIVARGLLIAATENDTVYALRPATGTVVWRRHLGSPQPQSGLPCGDIDPLGITGTPAYDARTHSVFVVAETVGGHHTLWALGAATGHSRWHRSLDVERSRNRSAEQQRAALLVTHGRVISTFGGLDGDCDNYVGFATSVAATGKGKTRSYAVPTAREAGMWAPGGPALGPNGDVYVSAGNGAATSGRWDKSDSITELAPRSLHRLAVFAPSTWAADNRGDLDLGSSSPVPVHGRMVIAGKRGTVYLLRQGLGGVGSSIRSVTGCTAFGAAAHRKDIAVMPCRDGVRALAVGRHGLRWRWTADGTYGSPVIAGRWVYLADPDNSDLVVLSMRSGAVRSRTPVGSLTHFPSEVVDGGMVFVPTLAGITALRGR